MAVLAEVSKSNLTFKPDILKKNAHFLPQIQRLTRWCLGLLVIAHTARIASGQTDRYTHTPHRTTSCIILPLLRNPPMNIYSHYSVHFIIQESLSSIRDVFFGFLQFANKHQIALDISFGTTGYSLILARAFQEVYQ